MKENGRRAIVLVGGQGTRIRHLIGESRQKVLFAVGGKPLLQYTLDILDPRCVQQVILCVNHGEKEVRNWAKGCALPYSIEFSTQERPGIANAIIEASKKAACETMIVCNGDEIRLGLDVAEALRFHRAKKFPSTMVAACANHLHKHRVLEIDESDSALIRSRLRAPEFANDPERVGLINTGFLILDKSVVPNFDALRSEWSAIIDPLREKRLMGVHVAHMSGYFNVGTEEEIRRAEDFLKNVRSTLESKSAF